MAKKYNYLKVLQGNYGCGWEDLTTADANDRDECKALSDDLRAYRENEPGYSHRVISRRVLTPAASEAAEQAEREAIAAAPRSFTFRNISDVKAANKAIGNHYFSPDTMRFFNGKVYAEIFHGKRFDVPGVYFVTSERCDWRDGTPEQYPRTYTVRFMPSECGSFPCPHNSGNPRQVKAGEVFNASEFEAYTSKAKAIAAAAVAAATNGADIPAEVQ